MKNQMYQTRADSSHLMKGALISGLINAIINGAIQYFLLRGHEGPLAMSVDSIGTSQHTVLGASVPLAVSLAMILTAVAHWSHKGAKKPFIPTTLWLVFKHGIFAFGLVVALAVLWQRYMGTVEISLFTAVVVLGLIAGIVSAIVNYLTLSEVVED